MAPRQYAGHLLRGCGRGLTASRRGRPFNVIYMPMAFKFDFFPAAAFTLGMEELARAIYLADTGLSKAPAPFVTPEDPPGKASLVQIGRRSIRSAVA